MKQRFVGYGLMGLAGLMGYTEGVRAQVVLAESAARERSGDATSVLARPVSIVLDRVPLKQAVRAIAERADVRLQYQAELLDAERGAVSLRVSRMPLGEVLDQALRGTQLQAVPFGADVVTIKPLPAPVGQGTIVGTIRDAKTKQPVRTATVQVNGSPQRVSVNEDGTFRLSVGIGEHVVNVRSVGYARQAREVTLREGETVTVEFALDPSASVLDEVVVTGTVVATARKEIATPITVITGEELEKRGITRIEQLFRGEVPGLVALDLGSYAYSTQDVGGGVRSTIYSRGSASLNGAANPIKTYVDGVELVDPSYLGTLDPRSIEKIEIITGPQAATIYGSGAMGGVMQIFTKKGSGSATPEFQVTMKYGMLQNNFSDGITPAHNDAVTIRGGNSPELTYSGSLGYDYAGQWQPKLYSGRYSASMGATHVRGPLTVSAAFSMSASRQGTWKFGFSQDYALLQLLTGPEAQYYYEDIGAKYYSDQVSLSSNQMISLNADMRVTSAWQHHLTLGKSQNVMSLKPKGPNFSDGYSFGTDTLLQVNRLNGQRFTWNYNTSYVGAYAVFSSALTLGANGSTGDQLSVTGGQLSAQASSIVGADGNGGAAVTLPLNDKSWGAFGSWRVGLFRQLYTTVGIRMEQNARYGDKVNFDFTPTNGLTYTFEQGPVSVKLMGSYGRATRPPLSDQRLEVISALPNYDPSSFISQFANPELRPEYSRGPQGGIEVYLGNLASLTVNHYQQTITDLIQRVPVDSIQLRYVPLGILFTNRIGQYQNIAKIRQLGWEGTGAVQIGPVAVKGTYSWNDSRVISMSSLANEVYYAVGETFNNLPTHTANVTLGYAHGFTSVMLVTNYIGDATAHNSHDLLYWQVDMAKHRMYAPLSSYSRLHYYKTHPGYTKTDLAASRRITTQLTATLNVLNVGNGFQSDDSELNPSLGRQTTLGFSYRFGRR